MCVELNLTMILGQVRPFELNMCQKWLKKAHLHCQSWRCGATFTAFYLKIHWYNVIIVLVFSLCAGDTGCLSIGLLHSCKGNLSDTLLFTI